MHVAQVVNSLTAGVEALRVGSGYFDGGTGPILYARLNCDGTESILADCSSSSYYYGASHSSDAGVRCQRTPTSSKEDRMQCIMVSIFVKSYVSTVYLSPIMLQW